MTQKFNIALVGSDGDLSAKGMKFSPRNVRTGEIISVDLHEEAVRNHRPFGGGIACDDNGRKVKGESVRGATIYRAAVLALNYAVRCGGRVTSIVTETINAAPLAEAAAKTDEAEAAKAEAEAHLRAVKKSAVHTRTCTRAILANASIAEAAEAAAEAVRAKAAEAASAAAAAATVKGEKPAKKTARLEAAAAAGRKAAEAEAKAAYDAALAKAAAEEGFDYCAAKAAEAEAESAIAEAEAKAKAARKAVTEAKRIEANANAEYITKFTTFASGRSLREITAEAEAEQAAALAAAAKRTVDANPITGKHNGK